MTEITGDEEILKNLNKFSVDADKVISEAIRETAFKVQANAIRSLQTESVGRRYGKHIASAPGDPPNTDTGRLVGSISVRHEFQVAWVFTNLDYGEWLEFGTTRIDPRPWLEPAALEQAADFRSALKKSLEKELR